jgi:hypothetical protein
MSRYAHRLKFWAVKSGDGRHAVAWDMSSPTRQSQFVPAVEQLDSDLQNGDFHYATSGNLRPTPQQLETRTRQVRGVDAQGQP